MNDATEIVSLAYFEAVLLTVSNKKVDYVWELFTIF